MPSSAPLPSAPADAKEPSVVRISARASPIFAVNSPMDAPKTAITGGRNPAIDTPPEAEAVNFRGMQAAPRDSARSAAVPGAAPRLREHLGQPPRRDQVLQGRAQVRARG